ncbi:MAG: citrate/2-methylcitrate synthase [Phycisphaerales bacterium]|nr:citrate/2-methylcitrate synthase [Phycisphaerales bacterium]
MAEATVTMNMDKGLDHTIIGESTKSFIDGQKGVLEFLGIDIDALARHSTFEEVVFLLWNDRLPSADELAAFEAEIRSEYEIGSDLMDMLRLVPRDASPMHVLRTMVSAMGTTDPDCNDQSFKAERSKALKVLAKTPAIIAAFSRLRSGKDPVAPKPDLNIATNFLWMLNGEMPGEASARAIDVCLVLHADHGINASTFSAMVTIATQSDMYSSLTSAIGTLRGPLHGGANERVMRMLQEIGSIDKVDEFVEDSLANKRKIMGFGHRVYKALDPRAKYLRTFAEQIADETGNHDLYAMSTRIQEIMEREVGDRGIYPNVDFYSATTYFSLGLEIDLFTPVFALSRNAGWAAHVLEQHQDNRLIRPRCQYTGPHGAPYVAIEDR